MARESNNAIVLRNGPNGHSFRASRQEGIRQPYRDGKSGNGSFFAKKKEELKIRLEETLNIFPVLKEKIKVKAGTLSGGQQQMLALARGLMTEPKVLLLDEPSLGLAPKIVKEVFAKIKEINERHQTAIMVVEHNIKSLLDIASRGYVLDKGKVVAKDSSQKLLESGILERMFVGKSI